MYTGVESTKNYDSIYQSDMCGWVGQIGYNKESVYGANVFTAQKNEKLRAAGFYAVGKDTTYQVYVVKDFKDTSSFEKKERVAQGKLDNAGYYTIRFDKEIKVEPGEKFAIVIFVNTPDAVHPLAIEYAADATTAKVDLSDGEGYISPDGRTWESAEDTQSCNLCIKAYAGK